MSYNRKYHLQRVCKLQEYVLDILNEHPGLPYTKVYTQYVKAEFNISYGTFTKWLGVRAKSELEKIKQNPPPDNMVAGKNQGKKKQHIIKNLQLKIKNGNDNKTND